MVRRLLLIVCITALALAMPAAAEEGVESPAPGAPFVVPEPVAAECRPFDPLCLAIVHDAGPVSHLNEEFDASTCRTFDLTSGPSGAVDPDGCWETFIERTVGGSVEVATWNVATAPTPWPI